MYKAKGWKFDNIFLLLKNIVLFSDEEKRSLYVVMTREKQNLYIYLNESLPNNINMESIERMVDSGWYKQPDKLYLHVSHKELY